MTEVPSGDGIHLSASELIALKPRCNALSLPMKSPAASALAGAYRSRFRGRGVDFVESRNYLPGDDIRNMDWRVTARTGKPHTKIFQEERERPVLIVVDANPSLYLVRACGSSQSQQDSLQHRVHGLRYGVVTGLAPSCLHLTVIASYALPAAAGAPCVLSRVLSTG